MMPTGDIDRLSFIEDMQEREERDRVISIWSQECAWYLCILWLYCEYPFMVWIAQPIDDLPF